MNFIPFPTLFIIFSVAFWNFFDIHEKVKKTECGRILLDHTVQTRSVFRNWRELRNLFIFRFGIDLYHI